MHVVFLDKKVYSHCGSLQPGVQMGAGNFKAGGSPMMTNIPFRV